MTLHQFVNRPQILLIATELAQKYLSSRSRLFIDLLDVLPGFVKA